MIRIQVPKLEISSFGYLIFFSFILFVIQILIRDMFVKTVSETLFNMMGYYWHTSENGTSRVVIHARS